MKKQIKLLNSWRARALNFTQSTKMILGHFQECIITYFIENDQVTDTSLGLNRGRWKRGL